MVVAGAVSGDGDEEAADLAVAAAVDTGAVDTGAADTGRTGPEPPGKQTSFFQSTPVTY